MGVNYGLNKLRFMAPVRAGKRIRGRFTIADVTERSPAMRSPTPSSAPASTSPRSTTS
jgi:acyl dehydratase